PRGGAPRAVLLRAGRPPRVGAGAGLARVATACGGATHGAAGDEHVWRTGVALAIAVLGHVAGARRTPADDGRRLLQVGRTRRARPGAELGGVAEGHRAAAHDRGRREAVRWAGCARSGAALGDVAVTGSGSTRGSRRREEILRAGVVHAVAGLGSVARGDRRPAHGRALEVGRARRAIPGARLRHVAHPRGSAAEGPRLLEDVGG